MAILEVGLGEDKPVWGEHVDTHRDLMSDSSTRVLSGWDEGSLTEFLNRAGRGNQVSIYFFDKVGSKALPVPGSQGYSGEVSNSDRVKRIQWWQRQEQIEYLAAQIKRNEPIDKEKIKGLIIPATEIKRFQKN